LKKQGMKNWISKKKKRTYIKGNSGDTLDMAFIADRVLAMGFPFLKSGFSRFNYCKSGRNDFNKVKKFLDKHVQKYLIVNLCAEDGMRDGYDKYDFAPNGTVINHGFPDHNPPNFLTIDKCMEDIEEFMTGMPDSLVALYCKAGKGRTGFLICCFLLRQMKNPKNKELTDAIRTKDGETDAEKVMHYYGDLRTWDGDGVTLPGQRRYICQYAEWLKLDGVQQKKRSESRYRIKTISIIGKKFSNSQFKKIKITCTRSGIHEYVPSISSKDITKEREVSVTPTETKVTSYKGKSESSVPSKLEARTIDVSGENIIVSGDFTISFNGKFSLTYNTIFFVEENRSFALEGTN